MSFHVKGLEVVTQKFTGMDPCLRRVVGREVVRFLWGKRQCLTEEDTAKISRKSFELLHKNGWDYLRNAYSGLFRVPGDAPQCVGDTIGHKISLSGRRTREQQHVYIGGTDLGHFRIVRKQYLRFLTEQRSGVGCKQHVRFLRYIPFHGQNKRRRKIPPPPPVFATQNNPVHPAHESILQPDDQQLEQLSPCHAVNVLQAFLPVLAVAVPEIRRTDASISDVSTSEEEGSALDVAVASEPSVPRTAQGRDNRIYLHLKVNADLSRESVRGVCNLQYGIGSDTKLAVFCPDEEVGISVQFVSIATHDLAYEQVKWSMGFVRPQLP